MTDLSTQNGDQAASVGRVPTWKNRVFLLVASLLFFGWLGYLGYTALMKPHSPVVSHVQASIASTAVVAELDDLSGKAKVEKVLAGNALQGEIEVENLSNAKGYAEQGLYLLYLTQRQGAWYVVGQQRSPGFDLTGADKPLIYPWTEEVRKQAEKLLQ